jgi:hypothetical protein
MSCRFIGEDNLLGLAILPTRGGPKGENGYQYQEQGRAEEGKPEIGVVHFESSSVN